MVDELSGGMAQRLMIARALAHRPEVLFLDEPTSGLDPQTRINLWEILRELHDEGLTILLTTHYMEEADELCERLAIIDHGRCSRSATPAELKRAARRRHRDHDHRRRATRRPLRQRAADARRGAQGRAATGRIRDPRRQPAGLLRRGRRGGLAAGVEMRDASSLPPSLENVFLNLTGREYRE